MITITLSFKWMEDGYHYHLTPNSQVVDFTTTAETQWVRVYKQGSDSKDVGNWLMKVEDIEGLSAQDIAKKYSLPQIPDSVVDVTIPPNQKIQASIANNILKGKADGGGGVQFELQLPEGKKALDTWFTNARKIQ